MIKIDKEYIGLRRVKVEFAEHEIRAALIEKACQVASLPVPAPAPTMDHWTVDRDGKFDEAGHLVVELVWTYRDDANPNCQKQKEESK